MPYFWRYAGVAHSTNCIDANLRATSELSGNVPPCAHVDALLHNMRILGVRNQVDADTRRLIKEPAQKADREPQKGCRTVSRLFPRDLGLHREVLSNPLRCSPLPT